MAGEKFSFRSWLPFAIIALVVLLCGAAVLCALLGVMALSRTGRPPSPPGAGETATVERPTPLPRATVPPSPGARPTAPLPPFRAQNVELVGHIGGTALSVAVDGDYGYVGIGQRLVILDIADPVRPVIAGQTGLLPVTVEEIVVSGDYAYIANGGLGIIDVSNPAHPVEVGFYSTPGEAWGMAVSGNYAYVTYHAGSLEDHLGIIDVSDPRHPVEIGFYEGLGLRGVAASGNYAFVADASIFANGLHIIDVSDPWEPVEVGLARTPGYVSGVAISGNYAYVAFDYGSVAEGGGLGIIDISDPRHPVMVSSCETPGDALRVAVSGNTAYVAAGEGGLRVIDVSNPENPVEVGFWKTPSAVGQAIGVAVSGNTACVADGNGGLFILRFTRAGQ